MAVKTQPGLVSPAGHGGGGGAPGRPRKPIVREGRALEPPVFMKDPARGTKGLTCAEDELRAS